MKYIIDTDIGDDIDDAFALLLAMDLRMELIGITTVFQDTAARARIAGKMLRLYGRGYEHVPVYAGYGTPIARPTSAAPSAARPCQYTADLESNLYAPYSADPNAAVDFIIDSCRKYRDELTVIAIGPFTNMARVLEKSPEALNLAAEVIIMGGCYFKQYTDWNVVCDVEAAKAMFDGVERMACIGADVTHGVPLREADHRIILGEQRDAVRGYVRELYRLAKKANSAVGCLHDPLAIYYACDKSICTCETAPVSVITEGYARGFTVNVTAYRHTAQNPAYRNFDFSRQKTLAREVDRERMLRIFMKCFEK